MNSELVCSVDAQVLLECLSDEDPQQIIDFVLTTEDLKVALLKEIEAESSQVIQNFGRNLIFELELSRKQVFGVLRNILKPLEQIYQFQLLKKPTNIFNELKQKRLQMRDEAGLRWQMHMVGNRPILCAWLDLPIFFNWFYKIDGVKELFPTPKNILAYARFIDGYPIFRFGAAADENGMVQVSLKILNNHLITESSSVVIPIWRALMQEKYNNRVVSSLMAMISVMVLAGGKSMDAGIFKKNISGPLFLCTNLKLETS